LKKKVLVLGIGQSNYIFQLYGTIKDLLPDYSFNISGLRALFKQEVHEKARTIFDEIVDLENRRWSLRQKLKAIFFVCSKRYVYKEMALLLLEGSFSFSNIKKVIIAENAIPFLIANEINNSDFSILHIHFIISEYTLFIKYLKKQLQIISTFWGSDLMRFAGHKQYYYQSLALERSDIITCATYDMGNIVLSKYGRHLAPKIRYAKFIHDPKVYDLIDVFRGKTDWQDNFRKKYSIPKNNEIIIIGHNATPENNHIRIIESFGAMSEEEQASFTCILPLSYAARNKEYMQALKSCTEKYKMQFIFLEEYLSWDELAQLKLIAAAMVHMPVSDGLSAALTEYFYAGGLAVTASWLPYSTFLQEGLFYFEYGDFDGLKCFWKSAFKDKSAYEMELKRNVEIVGRVFDINYIAKPWQKIFNELI